MKVTYNWLKELVDITESVQEVSAALTSAGLEVASVEARNIPDGVIVSEIVSVEKHPDSDHLSICRINTGKDDLLTVVCGAPNVKSGMKCALATIGTALAPDFTVKKACLRKVDSYGMLCSEKELKISDNHDGILDLPDHYEIGKSLNNYLENDYVIEIELTPNRGDCLSVLGVAREVSALFHKPLKPAVLIPEESDESIENCINVSIEDEIRCPRYMGRLVRGVSIKDSPLGVKRRLYNLDIRPICNVVDVTNYILLLFGQPMHSFDYSKIKGKSIVVKCADNGQKFITLDDIERKLNANDLLICDAEQPTALAGIMGGAGSGITENTADVFLECAYFDPVSIRKTSKRLDLSSESSYRFERGVDPGQGCADAIDTAAALIQRFAGGVVAKNVIDVHPKPVKTRQIKLRPSRVSRLLGIPIDKDTIISCLASLQIELISEEKEQLLFKTPVFRHDLELEVDLIEEVGRLYGYDKIPVKTSTSIIMDQSINTIEKVCNKIRTALAARGFHETVTNSMTSKKNCDALRPDKDAVVIINPLNPEMSRMRTNLLCSLLEVTAYNLNRKNINNRFFEIGKVIYKNTSDMLPTERTVVAMLIEGNYVPRSWKNNDQHVDFYILKNVVESLRTILAINTFTYTPLPDANDTYYSSESAACSGYGIRGTLGKIKNDITSQYSVKNAVYYAEFDITDYLQSKTVHAAYSTLPRFPAIERDFSFVMKDDILSSVISEEIYSTSELVKYVQPFDVYKGDNLKPGLKSITFSVKFRAEDKTLTDKNVEKICTKIISQMKTKYNIELRK